ncbi:unnamed protein product [Paramecium sonneborni]|uniref:Uncharacterized protein n=1 Tax=Paramecium sonneborni TaxID=65129 RepID=A0A8S1RLL1_9CILI|nr:unnamed protein product [Paramecium sonneborni]
MVVLFYGQKCQNYMKKLRNHKVKLLLNEQCRGQKLECNINKLIFRNIQENDNDKNGNLNEIIFNYIIQEHLQLIDEEIENIVMFMDCKSEINYYILFNMLKSSNQIQQIERNLIQKYRPANVKKENHPKIDIQ